MRATVLKVEISPLRQPVERREQVIIIPNSIKQDTSLIVVNQNVLSCCQGRGEIKALPQRTLLPIQSAPLSCSGMITANVGGKASNIVRRT